MILKGISKDIEQKKIRDSNIELLRIVCMLLVVMHHYAVHSGFSQVTACNRMLLDAMAAGARMAINCFILMTGYFSITMKRPVWNKLFRMWTERFFYAFVISVVFLVVGLQKFSASYVTRAVFPIITCRHNYVTTFFMLYLLIPYINVGVGSLSKKQFLSFLGVCVFVISLVPTFMGLFKKLYVNNSYSYLFWMIFVYSLGAYFRLYGLPLKRKLYVWGGVGVYSFIIFMTLVVEPRVSFIPRLYTANKQLNFFVLIASVCLFWSFLGLKIQSKFVNYVAGSTFAVLLIHDDPLVRGVVWSKIARAASHGMSRYLFCWAGMTIIVVYVSCVVIDKICKFLFINRFWRKHS